MRHLPGMSFRPHKNIQHPFWELQQGRDLRENQLFDLYGRQPQWASSLLSGAFDDLL
jgi:hypothetical protein